MATLQALPLSPNDAAAIDTLAASWNHQHRRADEPARPERDDRGRAGGRVGQGVRGGGEYQASIAGAVEEQTATTNELSRLFDDATAGADSNNRSIGQVAATAAQTADGATSTRGGSQRRSWPVTHAESAPAAGRAHLSHAVAGTGRVLALAYIW